MPNIAARLLNYQTATRQGAREGQEDQRKREQEDAAMRMQQERERRAAESFLLDQKQAEMQEQRFQSEHDDRFARQANDRAAASMSEAQRNALADFLSSGDDAARGTARDRYVRSGGDVRNVQPPAPRNIDPNDPKTLALKQQHAIDLAKLQARLRAQEQAAGGGNQRPPTEGQLKARAQLELADKALKSMEAVGEPSNASAALAQGPGIPFMGVLDHATRAMAGDKARQFDTAASMLGLAYLRATSGAAITAGEERAIAKQIQPSITDDEGTRKLKAEARRWLVDAIAKAANDPEFMPYGTRQEAEFRFNALMQELQGRKGGSDPAARYR